MLRTLFAAALLLGTAPAFAQQAADGAAARTIEQNQRVVLSVSTPQAGSPAPQANQPPPQAGAPATTTQAQSRAMGQPRPFALAQEGRAATAR